MTVDLNNESGLEADGPGLVRLATFALDQLRIHPLAELSILLVDEDDDERLPREVPGGARPDRRAELPDGRAAAARTTTRTRRPDCSATSCSARRSPPGRPRSTAGSADAEAEYLLVHGLLHLLGYDHAEPDEKTEMFALKDKILARWASARPTGRSRPGGRR